MRFGASACRIRGAKNSEKVCKKQENERERRTRNFVSKTGNRLDTKSFFVYYYFIRTVLDLLIPEG
jgi:hypothetical protein